jgi:hypothetical protein
MGVGAGVPGAAVGKGVVVVQLVPLASVQVQSLKQAVIQTSFRQSSRINLSAVGSTVAHTANQTLLVERHIESLEWHT